MFLGAQTMFRELLRMVDERFDLFTITGQLIDATITTVLICTIILFMLECPATGIRTMICRTVLSLSGGTLNVFPARNERLDAPDSLNGYFMLINGNAYALDPFNVGP